MARNGEKQETTYQLKPSRGLWYCLDLDTKRANVRETTGNRIKYSDPS